MADKVITIKMYCDTGFVGCIHEATEDVEVPENATEAETEEILEDATRQWAYDRIDIYHKRINPPQN